MYQTDYVSILCQINEIEKKIAHHNHDKYITTPEFNTFTANILL